MRARRAHIDQKLDLLSSRTRQARRQLVVPGSALIAAAIAVVVWRSWRRRHAKRRLRLVA
jgi:hypothetical protein